MRGKRFFIAILIFIVLLSNQEMRVFAMNTGFSTEALSYEEKSTFLTNASISLLTEEPHKQTIECFDVNDDGLIALGFNNYGKKTICIYDENRFQYGYEFNCSGTFGIEWDGNNINIYFTRSDVIVSVNQMGKIEDILKTLNTTDNNSYQNHSVFSTTRTVGDTTYTLKNDMGIINLFASSYSQLVATRIGYEETVLYNVSTMYLIRMIAVLISAIIFVCIVIVIVLKKNTRVEHRGRFSVLTRK